MTTEVSMKNTDKRSEEAYLRKTLRIVEDNLQYYNRETTRMQAEIEEMLEHYHDDDVELWTLLNNTITLNKYMKRALQHLFRAKNKPYFGRIIFRDEALQKTESLYIGKCGISNDRISQAVIDWRAPVANIYYENGLGSCSYKAPDGSELIIDLQLKRTFEIEEGKLLDYYDTEVVANDDLLTKYLSKNKEAVLGEIVATIQKEQNEIIRKTPFHNIIVQGVAGSGKTTVAMHRISYILYNYKERFRPEDFYIVGSNRILLNYITGVLPDLDVYGVRQMTMEQLFTRLLYEDWDEKRYKTKALSGSRDICKGTGRWYRELLAFIRRLEQKSISTDSVYLNPREFVEGLQDGKTGVFDRSREDEAAGRKPLYRELVSHDAIVRYLRENPKLSIQSKINMLNDRLLTRLSEEFLGKSIAYTEAEQKAILRAYRGRYGKKSWKTSIYQLYQEFLLEQRSKGYEVTPPDTSFDVYDLAALALLYKLVKETEVISEAHHIVIDEAQDFGMMAYHALHDCIRDCTYTVMGDVSQNIHFGYGLADWEELRQLLLPNPMDSFGILKKSYRNTVEISEFATGILRHGNFPVYPVEPIIRHGSPVSVEPISAGQEGAMADRAAAICREWQEKGYDTIAVICRNEQQAASAAAELSSRIPITESDLEKVNFGNGIMVLPVEYTKGLEFDAVLIWNPDRSLYPSDDGHAKLLYVAATRALHELSVLYLGSLSGLIADPVPERKLSYHEATISTQQTASASRPAAGKEKAPAAGGARSRLRPIIPQKTGSAQHPAASAAQRVNTAHPPAAPTAQELHTAQKVAAPQAQPVAAFGSAFGAKAIPGFGDMPETGLLRPAGHAKINAGVRWVTRQNDGLYLQSQYGLLRICPVGSGILRLTFSRGSRLPEGVHPLIATTHVEKNWKYRDNGKCVELATGELLVRADKTTGSLQYFDNSGRLLLAERKSESRQTDGNRSWLYLDLEKKEQLYAAGGAGEPALKLRGSARYLSPGAGMLPFFFSDKGYGMLVASEGCCMFCDIPAYGTYLYTDTAQMDFYLIAGKQQQTILNARAYLLGLL